MSRHTARARSGSDRTSLYDEITDKIITELEAGRVPWVQPWGTAAAKAPLAMPMNAATDRFYSGINVLILWGSVIEHGFPTQGWLTFRQALGLGGNVRKGEHGTTVVYADSFIPDDEKKRAQETGEEAQTIPFLKRFTVFNLAQCEGLPEDLVVATPPPEPGLIEPRVEALIKATGIDFRIGGRRAFYMPTQDCHERAVAKDFGEATQIYGAEVVRLVWNEDRNEALAIGDKVRPVETALRLACALLAERQQPAQPRVGRPVRRIDENGHAVSEIEAAADDQPHAGRLGGLVGANDAREAVAVDDRQAFDAQRRGLCEELVAGTRPAKEAEMRGALQLDVSGRAAHPKIPCRNQRCEPVSGSSPSPAR